MKMETFFIIFDGLILAGVMCWGYLRIYNKNPKPHVLFKILMIKLLSAVSQAIILTKYGIFPFCLDCSMILLWLLIYADCKNHNKLLSIFKLINSDSYLVVTTKKDELFRTSEDLKISTAKYVIERLNDDISSQFAVYEANKIVDN